MHGHKHESTWAGRLSPLPGIVLRDGVWFKMSEESSQSAKNPPYTNDMRGGVKPAHLNFEHGIDHRNINDVNRLNPIVELLMRAPAARTGNESDAQNHRCSGMRQRAGQLH